MNKMSMIVLMRMVIRIVVIFSLASSRSLVVVLGQVQIEMYCVAVVSVVGGGADVVYCCCCYFLVLLLFTVSAVAVYCCCSLFPEM